MATLNLLVSHGADVNMKDEYGMQTIHHAAMRDNPNVMDILVR